MRVAEARRSASSMMSSSIKWSLTGWEVLCRTNTSAPRMLSSICTLTSESAYVPILQLPNGVPKCLATDLAKFGLAFPLKSIMRSFFIENPLSPLSACPATISSPSRI